MWGDMLEERRTSDALSNEVARLGQSRGLDASRALPSVVTDSWKRCLSDYQLVPDRVPRAAVLSRSELRDLSDTYQDLLAVAEPEVEKLFLRLVDSEYLVSLASPQGVMMLFRCDYNFLGDMSSFGVVPGSVWTEDRQGTNGVGTCLKVGKPVTIVGNHHYGAAAQSLTCLTAPVFGKFGVVESVLNVTTPRAGNDRANRVVQDIVERSARRIENRYFGRVHRKSTIIRLSEDREGVDLAEEGRLAIDNNGLVVAGTSFVAKLTGHRPEDLIGMPAEDVFELGSGLSEIESERPVPLFLNGRTVHAALTPAGSRPLRRGGIGFTAASSHPLEPLVPAVRMHSTPFPEPRLDPMTQMALDRAQKLLDAGLPLFVKGESGTGKTMFAQIAARRSLKGEGVIIEVDCSSQNGAAAIAEAAKSCAKMETGALILDRLDELDEGGQSALLSALENNLQLAGGQIRLIAVTVADLNRLTRDGVLRTDLFNRLRCGATELPSLRTVPDLNGVIKEFLKLELEALGKTEIKLDEKARLVLANYHWPGNIRELLHTLRHAIALAEGKVIGLDHLPADIVSEFSRKDLTARSHAEASRIEAALRFNGGNVTTTARHLGVSRATLYRKIQIQSMRQEAKADAPVA
jgi:sigma-54 dependent transcriptional regulator, acetoin dehydrogenase operon transcriptional activator AcoR